MTRHLAVTLGADGAEGARRHRGQLVHPQADQQEVQHRLCGAGRGGAGVGSVELGEEKREGRRGEGRGTRREEQGVNERAHWRASIEVLNVEYLRWVKSRDHVT